ncbi:indole-3-glycerol-phosphate synthase [Streptomyces dangxiongensis]|uniref:indole-3-glycerol-phosphate synthase n=1 Tax=Streptomyces dangxiongensis TaxID=1442032 RepID=A0A3G2JBI0_9ACTN|nr:indole-3-glycerol-phosphate synthase [Streptomyces dangxiongensis]AYN38961.1 indole-3-glycerol-phosphate synthase [Streptomyces dangxiongensis]
MNTPFGDALAAAARPLVMEVKLRDADGRDLLGGRGVAETVERFEAAGAPCLSVVTGHWFGGTEDLLREVASRTSLPLLRKDFVTSRRQLERTRELGASAVLLTGRLLPAGVLARLTDRALGLGLTPFVEVADAAEAAMVARGPECVVAVNNKDIATRERLSADLGRSLSLLPAVRATGTRHPVSASGITGPVTAARLLGAGFAGLLIGTELLRTPSLTAWCAEFDAARSTRGAPR